LGVENKLKSQIVDEKKSKAVVLKEVARGDRELARVFVEMLSSLGPGLVVAFRTPQLQKAAKKRWKLTKDEAGGRLARVSFEEDSSELFASPAAATRALNSCVQDGRPILEEHVLTTFAATEVEAPRTLATMARAAACASWLALACAAEPLGIEVYTGEGWLSASLAEGAWRAVNATWSK
ncbi:unnamed protein product, partial [Effrenium voratum]